nr:eIF-2-alpha kinase activator GCN1 isoform X20 [Ipomoea batatas]
MLVATFFLQALSGVYAKDVHVRMACLNVVKCIPALAGHSIPENIEVATSIWLALLHDPEKACWREFNDILFPDNLLPHEWIILTIKDYDHATCGRILTVAWKIWAERNNRIWNGVKSSHANTLTDATVFLSAWQQIRQHGMNMDDSIAIASIIDKLPPSWKKVHRSLMQRKEEITMEQLGSHLYVEEGIRQKESKNKGSARGTGASGSTINLVDEGKPNGNRKEKRKPGKVTKSSKFKKNGKGKGKAYVKCWDMQYTVKHTGSML